MSVERKTETRVEPILPPAWLGVLGGGQLGRMFTQVAHSLGYKVYLLDPDPASPAGALADRHLCAAYDDKVALAEMASVCAAVTTEFENIPVESLEFIAAQGTITAPGSHAVGIAQNRILEKRLFEEVASETGISPAPYFLVEKEADLDQVPNGFFPAILKTVRMGYDGKGQSRPNSREEAREAWKKLGQVTCVLEKKLDLAFEISALVARGFDGATVIYPPAENIHRNGILHTSTIPSPHADPRTVELVKNAAQVIARRLNYVGVLCIEFFVLTDGSVVVNEMATRPHNSGHYTMDAARTSQFEQQLRAMTRLPLGRAELHSPVVMLNLLGDLWPSQDQSSGPDWSQILAQHSGKLHLYGKTQARPGRKMGHINCVGRTLAEAQSTCETMARALGMD